MVGLYSIESTIDVLWNLACRLQFEYVSLQARRLVEALEKSRVGEFYLVALSIALVVSRLGWYCERE